MRFRGNGHTTQPQTITAGESRKIKKWANGALVRRPEAVRRVAAISAGRNLPLFTWDIGGVVGGGEAASRVSPNQLMLVIAEHGPTGTNLLGLRGPTNGGGGLRSGLGVCGEVWGARRTLATI